MFALVDTFNKQIISRHRSIEAAVRGKAKLLRRFYRNNSPTSFLPTALMRIEKDGTLSAVTDAEQERFEHLECCC